MKIVKGRIKKVAVLVYFVIFGVASCDSNECTNQNPIFDKFSPESEEYKSELASQLSFAIQNKLLVNYYFEKLSKEGETRLMYTKVKGHNLCAVLILDISVPDEMLKSIIQVKGMGYRGAVLEGMNFIVTKDSADKGRTRFRYLSVEDIID
jgi:hypothetical protein